MRSQLPRVRKGLPRNVFYTARLGRTAGGNRLLVLGRAAHCEQGIDRKSMIGALLLFPKYNR
jgi:hypothetical protein